jgi:hypothetical protein
LIGILLFGSLASGTHTWKSDIDLIFVYELCEPSSAWFKTKKQCRTCCICFAMQGFCLTAMTRSQRLLSS